MCSDLALNPAVLLSICIHVHSHTHTHTSANTWFGCHNKELFIPYPTYKQSVNDSQHFNPPTNIIPNNTFSPYIHTDWTSDIIN